jgi:hypothetical protein
MSFLNPPSPPDPNAGIASGTQVANAQQGFNTQAGLQSQAGSMVNQSNPFGSLQYTQTGTGPNGAPIYSANTSLSPQQQTLFNTLMGTKGTAGGQASNLLSNANYGGQTPQQAVGNMASGLEGQMMAGYQQEMQPIQQTQRTQLDTQLRNQGLQPGEPGYDYAMRQYDTNVNNANAAAASNYAQTAFGQANTLYGEPLQMAESLGGFGAPTTPNASFVNAPALNIQPANLTGAVANQNQMLQQQYQNQMAQYSGMMNGLFGIGSDVLGVMTGGASLPFTGMFSGMGGGGGGSYPVGSTSDPYGVSSPYYTG